MIELKRLEVYELTEWAPRLKPWIERISNRSGGRYAPEHIWGWLESGEWQIWVVIESGQISFVCGTEIAVFPTGLRALVLHFATGSGRNKWQHRIADVIEFGKSQGCTRFQSVARKGWFRVLRGFLPWLIHSHDFIEGEI